VGVYGRPLDHRPYDLTELRYAAATVPPPSVTLRTSLASSCVNASRFLDRVAITNAETSCAGFGSISSRAGSAVARRAVLTGVF
jgi:hypothetical protein